MELYENINLILKENKLSKKDFAIKLQEILEKENYNKIPSDKSIYTYLSGKVPLKLELLPYIAQVLNTPIEFLFDNSGNSRIEILKYICNDLREDEKVYINHKLNLPKLNSSKEIYSSINELFQYAPEQFIINVEDSLQQFKRLVDGVKG